MYHPLRVTPVTVAVALAAAAASVASADVQLSRVAAAPTGPAVAVSYTGFDNGGNTSVYNSSTERWKAKGINDEGYYTLQAQEVPYIQRDRDLGQTFTYTGSTPVRLDAITTRTGFGDSSIRSGMYGQAVSIQLFQVSGTPVLNTNGTTGNQSALHGFPHSYPNIPAERDDYYTGETYTSLAAARNGVFPAKTAFGFGVNETPTGSDPRAQGEYLRWDLTGADEIVLQPGQRYAFLLMIDQPGPDQGFTVANNYTGSYAGGHGIRREGNGTYPPAQAHPSKPFTDPANAAALAAANFPADFSERLAISPGANGYPDVDTWRDIVFYVETAPVPEPATAAVLLTLPTIALVRRPRATR